MERFWEVLRDFLILSLVGLLIFWGASLLFQFQATAVVTAYLMSFLFIGSNFWLIRKIKKTDDSTFYRHFYISIGVRFILVLGAIIVILEATKIHEIYFTVSFLFSYILHSVIEIFSIEKILGTDN